MKRRILGSTDLKVSELCLGTMNFGWKIDEPTSYAILNDYRANGGNFIQGLCVFPSTDSSTLSDCASLSLVGRWWRGAELRRKDLVLSARLTWPRSEASTSKTPELVRRRTEEALRQLRTDYLDLLVCDWNESFLSNPEFRCQLDELVRTGKVRYHVVAHPRGWQLTELAHINYDNNHGRIEAVQTDYSLMARVGVETELMDFCARKRMGLLVSSPLAGGLLTRSAFSPSPGVHYRFNRLATKFGESTRAVSAELAAIAREKGATFGQVGLAWVLHNPVVTSVIIGGTSIQHFAEMSGSTCVRLSPEDLARLGFASQTQRVFLPGIRQTATVAAERSDAAAKKTCRTSSEAVCESAIA
ncbi:MAG: aldo/keto reductase [Nibricoccus sp.]